VRAPLLHDVEALGPDQRWRLVAGLFNQTKALVVGSLVLTGAMAAASWLSDDVEFTLLVPLSLVVLAWRLAVTRQFNAAAPEMPDGTPELWAKRFRNGALLFASLWGAADLIAMMTLRDPLVPLFVQMVQAGWVAGSAARNAASPATVRGQTLLAILPSIIGTVLTTQPVLHWVTPFLLVQILATETISRYGAQQIAALLRSEQKLEAANAQLLLLSTTDPLTGIGNRRAFDNALAVEWARAARDSTSLALLAIDVDHFKAFNDRYGHPAGDTCLRLIASVIDAGLRRPPDYAARVGGEEFTAILPGTDLAGALEVAERLRVAVAAAAVPHEAIALGHVTISIGAHSAAPRPGTDPAPMISLADQALYAAKQGGRNQVRAAYNLAAARPEAISRP